MSPKELDVVIEPMSRIELRTVSRLLKDHSADTPMSTQELLEAIKGGAVIKVARVNRKVVGACCYISDECKVTLLDLVVKAKFRRQRIATMLLRAVEDHYTGRCKGMVYCVNEYNVPAQLFLRRYGFKWKRTLAGYFGYPVSQEVAHKLSKGEQTDTVFHDGYKMIYRFDN